MKFLLKESWRDREADGHGCRHTCMAGRSPVSRLRVDDDDQTQELEEKGFLGVAPRRGMVCGAVSVD